MSFNFNTDPRVDPRAAPFQPKSTPDTEPEIQCASCHKPQSHCQDPLKQCAKCKTVRYCSRECQRADWKGHKRRCRSSKPESGTSTSSTKTTTKPCHLAKPFAALKNKTWLKSRPEAEVYKLLIDVYRMRVEDEYKFKGDVEAGSMYDGGNARSALRCLTRFLTKMTRLDARRPANEKILPDWWGDSKVRGCIQAASVRDDWSWIEFAIEKPDVQEHYKDDSMPMQLRMFSEYIDGTKVMNQSCKEMLEIQAGAENGRVPEWARNGDGSAVSLLNIFGMNAQ